MRVGLVLGAGGIVGASWLIGGLDALASETGWDPASADYVVGTSAGAVIAALCTAGVPPWFMIAHARGDPLEGVLDANGRPAGEADRRHGAVFRLQRALPPLGPGSWRLIASTLADARRHTPAAVAAGWLPRGMVSTEPIKDFVRRTVPHGWAPHPNLWLMACDYATGRRVAFGRADAPRADLADAAAASCAIPGFYHPVAIDGRRYVDGGMYSPSNLDVLRGRKLDLVICLNPSSTLDPRHARNPAEWVAGPLRSAAGRRLGHEARRLRAEGTDVVLIQPDAADLDVMGTNPMSGRRRARVLETAPRTVVERLRAPEVRRALADLPPGRSERVRRPSGPPRTWPSLAEVTATG